MTNTPASPDPSAEDGAPSADPSVGAELDPQTAADAGVLEEVAGIEPSPDPTVAAPAPPVGEVLHSNLPTSDLSEAQLAELGLAGTVAGPGAVGEEETVELEVEVDVEPGDTVVTEDGEELVVDTVEDASGTLTRDELEELTNDELLDLGQDIGVHVTTHMTKAELVESIVAGPQPDEV